MSRGVVITSHRSVSLKKVSYDIKHVLEEAGHTVTVLEYPYLDPQKYEQIDFGIIVMTFDPVWVSGFGLAYRLLRNLGKLPIFYTTVEGRLRKTPGTEWMYRDIEYIANSRYTAKKLREAGAKITEIVYHGVDVEAVQKFKWAGKRFREKIGVKEDDFLVGYLAAGYMRKGHPLFNEVVKYVAKKDPSIKFVVITDDKGAEAYDESPNLLLYNAFGKMTKPTLYGFYHAINLYAHGALSEGFGLPVLEALAAGKRVVHADYEPLSEITDPKTSYRAKVVDVEYRSDIGAIEYELHYYDPQELGDLIIQAKEEMQRERETICSECVERAKMFDLHKVYSRFVEIVAQHGAYLVGAPIWPGVTASPARKGKVRITVVSTNTTTATDTEGAEGTP